MAGGQKVWIVTVGYPSLCKQDGFVEIRGVFGTENAARDLQENLIGENAAEQIGFGVDLIDVCVEEWEVDGAPVLC